MPDNTLWVPSSAVEVMRGEERGGNEVAVYDKTGVVVMNQTDHGTDHLMGEIARQNPEIASLVQWTRGVRSRHGSILDRDRYVTPTHVWDIFRAADYAVKNDDVVGGVYETTEALAFSKVVVETDDDDETEIWAQIMQDIDIDARIREMWLAMYTFSQFYAATYYGQKTYKLENRLQSGEVDDKNRRARRKAYDLKVPLGMSILDPTKVVPVGNLLFNQDQLAYAAMVPEVDVINATINGMREADPIIRQLLVAPWVPDVVERTQLGHLGLPADRLYLMNPNRTFRHTHTRLQYERFAPVRLQKVFELLDIKAQLRQMDRAVLLASTNFLVVVKRGSKEQPATPAEIMDTDSKFRTMARVPVIVADHRFEVEIVTPKNDQTLNSDRYNTIDNRLLAMLLDLLIVNSQQGSARSDDSIKVARVIGRGLESKRHMLRRTLERRLLYPIWEANESLKNKPRLRFHPQHVALDLDPALLNFILDMRDRGDVSRSTMLEQIDLEEEVEARKVEREKEIYDDIFETVVPGAAAPGTPAGAGNSSQPAGAGNPPQSRSAKLAQHRAEPKKSGQTVPTTKQGVDPKAAGRRTGGSRNGGGTGRRGRGPGPNANDDAKP